MALRVLVVVLALLAAGCADSDGDPDPGTTGTGGAEPSPTATSTGTQATTSSTTSSSPSPTTSPRGPVTWEVTVGDNSYSPAALTIQVGDTVRWVQEGTNPHTVTEANETFDSHPDCTFVTASLGECMAEGEEFEWTFEEVGEVTYYCKLHGSAEGGGMAGTIDVRATFEGTP